MQGYEGQIEAGEMVLTGANPTFAVPSGTFAKWEAKR
jgi:hypothetical protein